MRSWLSQKPASKAPEESRTLVSATVQALKDIGWAPARMTYRLQRRGIPLNDGQLSAWRNRGGISFLKFNQIIENLPRQAVINFCIHLLCNLGAGSAFLTLQRSLQKQKPTAWHQVQEAGSAAVLNTATLRFWLLIHFQVDVKDEDDRVTKLDPAVGLIEVDGKGWVIPDICYAAKLREDDTQLLTSA